TPCRPVQRDARAASGSRSSRRPAGPAGRLVFAVESRSSPRTTARQEEAQEARRPRGPLPARTRVSELTGAASRPPLDYGKANAYTVLDATTATYCLPLTLYVRGLALIPRATLVLNSSWPVRAFSTQSSPVSLPWTTTSPAVTRLPALPMLVFDG